MAFIVYAGIIFCSSAIIIISAIEFINKDGYGYNGIITLINSNPFLLNINEKECNDYISNINNKKLISKVKTLINLSFNSLLFLYSLFRIRYPKRECKIGVFIFVIAIMGLALELIFTSISIYKFNKTKYDSDDFKACNYYIDSFYLTANIFNKYRNYHILVKILDIIVISFICFSFIPIFIGLCITSIKDCDANDCCEDKYCWIFRGICQCFEVLCGSIKDCLCDIFCCKCFKDCCKSMCSCCESCCDNMSICCDNCCRASKVCCDDEYKELKQNNNRLKNEYQSCEDKNKKLKETLEAIKNQRNNMIIQNKFYEVILFYIKNEINNEININAYEPQRLFINELSNNINFTIDKKKFEEITLYYIKSKLIEILTPKKGIDIFKNPMINKEGETLEIKNNNPNSELIENKLVKRICEKLEDKDKNSCFNMEKFKEIKKLLIYQGKYYENPVVFKTGKYKGETVDNDDKKEYKNKIIKQIINEIRDFLEDEYFNVDKIFASSGNDNNSQERLTLNENNINSTNRINHETQA